jgi:apolipoprotein N-acyltransferase
VWGTPGLSFVAAATAGAIADYLRHDRRWAKRTRSPKVSLFLGSVPLALAIALSFLTHPPATVPGPRVLLVQPSFEQHRKMKAPDWRELAEESIALTARGVANAGEPAPDLVAWGETMFPFPLAEPGLAEAYERGVRPPEWARDQLSLEWIRSMDTVENSWIRGRILGPEGILPPGTSYLTGVEHHAVVDGAIRRQNAIVLFAPDGRRTGLAGKVHLVPGAENMCGLERLGFVRWLVESVAGYVPDLVAFDTTQVLELPTDREGREVRPWRFGASVCFDNAYDNPYTAPLRSGDLDFHLVVSNEAWYETSFEFDQMVAFSRILAVATGRSIVRATNAGVSIVLDPSGSEVARLEAIPPAGRSSATADRMVPGTLSAVVPVPSPEATAERTLYVRWENAWLALFLGLPLLLAFFVVRGGYTAFERR